MPSFPPLKNHLNIKSFITVLLIGVLAGIASNYLSAQVPKFRHFDVSSGFPSSTVYSIFQDSKGYMWFCSEAGITKFDGTYVQNFTMDDGLADNEIFGAFEDSRGRIWTRAYNGRFSFVREGLIYHSGDYEFIRDMQSSPHWSRHILEDPFKNIYFSLGGGGLMLLDSLNQVTKVEAIQFKSLYPADSSAAINVLGTCYNAPLSAIEIFTSLGLYRLQLSDFTLSFVHPFDIDFRQFFFVDANNVFAIHRKATNTLYRYNAQLKDFERINLDIETNSRGFLPSKRNAQDQLWLGTLGDGIYWIDSISTQPTIRDRYLTDKAVSDFCLDTEGNKWFATLGDGVFMLARNTVLTYTEDQGLSSNNLYSVAADERGNVYTGTVDGQVNIINQNGNIRKYNPTNETQNNYDRITDILVNKDQSIWISGDFGLKVFGRAIPFDVQFIKSTARDSKGNVYVASSEGVFKITSDGSSEQLWDKRATAISPNDDGTAWIGANDGLYFYNGNDVIHQNTIDPLFNNRVSDLAQMANGILCVASGNGVSLYKGNDILHLTARNGLVGNVCRDIFIEETNEDTTSSSSTVWVAANTGISQFKVNAELTIDYIINYSEASNLASNDIRQIYVRNQQVWMATSEGLSFFDAQSQKQTKVYPPIYITSIRINDRDTTINSTYDLPYHQRNIRIGFTGVSFQSGSQLRYEYNMEGIDDQWISTYNTEVQYPDLRPGTYTFKVRAISINQIQSVQEATLQITIHSPWWETWWFRLLAVGLIAGIVYGITYSIILNRKQKEELSRRIVESEQMALRAQMNPHFVFNALNSIQHFITMEDEMSANYYLTRFSKLIRQVLENSKHSFITLHEEIESLKLYLELEMLRFEDKFEYSIDLDDEINDYDIEIPSMVIQPFLENAIWHGLMPKEGDAQLVVQFQAADIDKPFIICIIEDNGVGRKAAAEANKDRSKKHKSTGIANTVQRLRLLSNAKEDETLMEIIDLEKNDKALGTKVVLKIPFK